MIGDKFNPFNEEGLRELANKLVGEEYTIFLPSFWKETNYIKNYVIVVSNSRYGGIKYVPAGARNLKDLLEGLGVRYLTLIMRKRVRMRLNPRYYRYVERLVEVLRFTDGDKKVYVLWFYSHPSKSVERIINKLTLNGRYIF